MDPWNEKDNFEPNHNNLEQQFEDNFEFDKNCLPDSKEYLDSLERKLSKIQKRSNLLKDLSDRRQFVLENLINERNSTYNSQIDFELNEEVNTQEIIRHIRPEQPIFVGEVVHLIKHDFLGDSEDQDNNTEDKNPEKVGESESEAKDDHN